MMIDWRFICSLEKINGRQPRRPTVVIINICGRGRGSAAPVVAVAAAVAVGVIWAMQGARPKWALGAPRS